MGGYTMGEILSTLAVLTWVMLPLAISGIAFLDVARRPSWVWAIVGKSRLLWLWLVAVSMLTVYGGVIVAAWYLLRVRPILRRAEDGDLSKL